MCNLIVISTVQSHVWCMQKFSVHTLYFNVPLLVVCTDRPCGGNGAVRTELHPGDREVQGDTQHYSESYPLTEELDPYNSRPLLHDG